MAGFKSEGKCTFCDNTYNKSGIGRHLVTHLKKMDVESELKSQKAFHLSVTAAEMFLHLLINSKADFGDLDGFLRQIWLECCGHMSSFQIKGKHYDYDWNATEFGEKMDKQVGKVFKKGMKLKYDYDFGSTTQLEIKVLNEYKLSVFDSVLLLSRNEPLPILCHSCDEKPAETICSVCLYQGPSFFCKSCAKKHAKSCPDYDDYAEMPVVNSPRMGICAYDGGMIDHARDGVWKNA